MQPGVTVVLATVWLVVSVGVVEAATLHPSRLTLDQYSPLPPYRHGVYRRIEGQLDWKDQDPVEDRLADLSIGPRRSISENESPGRPFEAKYPGRDPIFPQIGNDASSNEDLSSLEGDKQLQNFVPSKFTNGRLDHASTKQPESFSREIPAPELEDPFVADDTFQDQGPGSVEIYKLDLFKEKALLDPSTTAKSFPKSKSKTPKKTHRLGWKEKTTEYKAFSPKVHHKQSNFFDELRTEVPANGESFGVGGVPELQVGCEGLEASSQKLRRSIDSPGKESDLRPTVDAWKDVTPISFDLDDYELSSEEGYEEMDELLKLKKLETTTRRVKQNRGDMEATLLSGDFFEDKRRSEKLPVRGDLGKLSVKNDSTVMQPASLIADEEAGKSRGVIGHDDSSKSSSTVNQGRKLLWQTEINEDVSVEDKERSKRSIWGFGEDEGVVSSDELQTVNERRRQEYERRKEERERRRQEDERRRASAHSRTNNEIDDIRREYEEMLQKREREEEERRRRIGQEIPRRGDDRRREEEETRRRLQEEETRRRHRLQEEERRRHELEASRRDRIKSHTVEEPGEIREREDATRRQELNRLHEEERRRHQYEEARRRQAEEDRSRQRQQEEEMRRRRLNEERRQRQQEIDAQRNERVKWEEEMRRRQLEEENRRSGNQSAGRLAEDRRNMEERRREWMMKRRLDEEEERRRQERVRNETPSNLLYPFRSSSNDSRRYETDRDRQMREQQEREREQKLREYVQRNQPIHVNRHDHRREQNYDPRRPEEQRRGYRPDDNRQDPRIRNATRSREEVERLHRTNVPNQRNDWLESRRIIDEARQYDRPRYPEPYTGRRNHGPSAPTNIDPRSYVDEGRRRQEARRLEEERRVREKQRHEEEERRKEALRREEETRRLQSRRYEEERKRLEAARLEDERRRKELIEEETRRSQAGRSWPLENTRPEYGDRRQLEEHRRRQDTSLIPANLALDESRRRAAERERQRQEQERRRAEAERRWREENRMRGVRPGEQRGYGHARGTMEESEQEKLRRDAIRKTMPVSARIIIYPKGTTSSTSSPILTSRTGFGNEVDFQGINPNRRGVEAGRFPVAATSKPPVKAPGSCVWAVVQCCPSNNTRLVTCFESLGCPGVNWDPNPCRGSIADAAREEVMKFYAAAEENDRF